MAPTHWSDLSDDDDRDESETASIGAPTPASPAATQRRLAPQAAPPHQSQAVERAQNGNPAFAKLIKEREALQQRMDRALSGGEGSADPRDAIRFAVPGMAQRRAEHEAWQQRRDRNARAMPDRPYASDTGAPLRGFGRALGPAGGIRAPRVGNLALRPTAGETPSGSALDPARWMQERDAGREGLRRRGPASSEDYDRLDQRLDRARSGASSQQNPMADLDRQFDDADRKLADEGMDSEREDLRRMKDDMNIDAFNRPTNSDRDLSGLGSFGRGRSNSSGGSSSDPFEKFRSTTDRRKDAGERIEQDWLSRRDAIGGEDMESYMRPLREAKSRVLGMRAEDFDARSDKRRTAALEKRRERLRQEKADEERRERALKNRKDRANAD